MRQGTAKELVRGRKLRRWLGLADDEQVVTSWLGPPGIPLEERGEMLRTCRSILQNEGYEIARARQGSMVINLVRRSSHFELVGAQAQDALLRDEEVADSGGHWWLHDAVWIASSPSRKVYAGVDPDGYDLEWICWGDPSVADTIRRLEAFLLYGDADLASPFFVFGDDVESFDSVGALIRYIEPWDVTADLAVFDSAGRRLKLRADGVVWTRRTVGDGWTIIDRQESLAPDGAALIAQLREHALRLARPPEASAGVARMDLPELVAFVHTRTRCG